MPENKQTVVIMLNERPSNLFSRHKLAVAVLTSVFSGIIVGIILRVSVKKKWSPRDIMYIKFIGEIFLRMLKCLILPTLVTSLVVAIGNLDLKSSSKIGKQTIIYYMLATFQAITLGIILVLTIRPGYVVTTPIQPAKNITLQNTAITDTILDLIRNTFPSNIVQAFLQQFQTILTPTSEDHSKY